MKKKIIFIAVIAALLMGTVAMAASLTDEQQDFFNQRKEFVDEMVDSGRITEDQGDEYLDNLEERLLDGTCDGTGTNSEYGQGYGYGLSEDGECLGLGIGNGNGRFADDGDDDARGFCGGRGWRN